MNQSESPFSEGIEPRDTPHVLDGSFEWLSETPIHNEWAIGDERVGQLASQLKGLRKSARQFSLVLPAEFVRFIKTPKLHKHLRSASGCYLDVAETVLPFKNGYLIRFLNDQQGCGFWYIYTDATGSDHCVVSSTECYDDEECTEKPNESHFLFEASSFESFLSQFWLENELAFSELDGTPPPDADPRILRQYRVE